MVEEKPQYQFHSQQKTDAGCVRELNEDSLTSLPGLWIVADGMGGHACGEVASALAIAEISHHYESSGSLSDAIQSAHNKIAQAGRANNNQSGMGTTVVAMSADEQQYQIAWVGDSRAYLWDNNMSQLTQISEDHSLIVRLINAGLISIEDAANHPQRHMITQCLGSEELQEVTVDVVENNWKENQQIILCSDGLTDEVPDETIAQIMAMKITVEEKIDSLVKTAKNAGGRDNISVIIVDSPLKYSESIFSNLKHYFKRIFSF